MFVMTAPDTDLAPGQPAPLSPVIIIPVFPGLVTVYHLHTSISHQAAQGSPALIVFPQPETEKRSFEQIEPHDVILWSKSWGQCQCFAGFVKAVCGVFVWPRLTGSKQSAWQRHNATWPPEIDNNGPMESAIL